MLRSHTLSVLLLLACTLASALPRRSRCATDADCDAALSCVGLPSNLRCEMRKAAGMRCGQDPFWVCEVGLNCIGGTCKETIRAKGECNDPGSTCDDGLSCVGNAGNKRCFMKKPLGMACGQDPFWVCEDALTCINGTCSNQVDTAGACNEPGSQCAPGLSCVGNVGNRKCFMKKGAGMKCGQDPFWVCADGLNCVGGTCMNMVGTAGACNDLASTCADGLSCVGNAGNRKCFMKKGAGMKCGQDPFWVCADGLNCVGGTCMNMIGTAGACNDPGSTCEDGLSCVGNAGNRKCFMKKGAGMKCGQDPFWVCADGLSCANGSCTSEPIDEQGACNLPGDACGDGLSCQGPPTRKRCVMAKGVGMECGTDPFWVCADGLECIEDMCRKVVGLNRRCGKRRVCRGRLTCAGPRRTARCVLGARNGMACGEFDACRPNFACTDGICRPQ